MKAGTFVILLFLAGLIGCGGLSYVNMDNQTDASWRALPKLAAVSATQPPPAAKTPPQAIPYKPIDIRGAYVAVFDILDKSRKFAPQELEGLTDYLASKLAEGGLFHVIPREEIKKRLRSQKTDSYQAAYDTSSQIEIGKEVAAQKSLSAQISEVGSSCLVTAALFDLQKSATDVTATTRGACNKDALVEQIEEIVQKFRRMSR